MRMKSISNVALKVAFSVTLGFACVVHATTWQPILLFWPFIGAVLMRVQSR